MDINQLARMIEWLDEERRRDKKNLTQMTERLAQQDDLIQTLQRRLGAVESDQSVMRHNTLPAEKEQQLLDRAREDMRNLLESVESRRLTAEREAERRQVLNREGIMRTVNDLQERVEKLSKSFNSINEVKLESDRIFDAVAVLQQRVDDLSKQLAEPDRRLTFLEEQRRQDARRISEVETEIPELRKSVDAVRPKVALIEELSLRNERRIQEQQTAERERRDQMQQFIDQQSLMQQQRDAQVKNLAERFAEHDATMQNNLERFETWAAAYRDMKRIIDDFERIGDRLERRINEVAEMQRLSEERFRQEWNDWRDDEQKRWKKLTISNDEVWRSHDKEFEQYIERLEAMEGAIQPLRDSLTRIWDLERKRAEMYRERYQSLLHEYDTSEMPHLEGTPPHLREGDNPRTRALDMYDDDYNPYAPRNGSNGMNEY